MALLFQLDYTAVSALKYMMTFCKQPFVDISVPFILKLHGRQMCVCMVSLAGPGADTTSYLHIFLIVLPLHSPPHPKLPESN